MKKRRKATGPLRPWELQNLIAIVTSAGYGEFPLRAINAIPGLARRVAEHPVTLFNLTNRERDAVFNNADIHFLLRPKSLGQGRVALGYTPH